MKEQVEPKKVEISIEKSLNAIITKKKVKYDKPKTK